MPGLREMFKTLTAVCRMGKLFKNILLDRDGTIIRDKHYLCDPDGVELLPGVTVALARMCQRGVRLFVVSNQSGIGRRYFKESACIAVNARMASLLAAQGVEITDSVYCRHHPDAMCHCRKPNTGLWEKLVSDYGLDPHETIMIGDKLSDVVFAQNCDLALSILVLTGHGADQARKAGLHLHKHEGPCRVFDSAAGVPDILARDVPTALHHLASRFM